VVFWPSILAPDRNILLCPIEMSDYLPDVWPPQDVLLNYTRHHAGTSAGVRLAG